MRSGANMVLAAAVIILSNIRKIPVFASQLTPDTGTAESAHLMMVTMNKLSPFILVLVLHLISAQKNEVIIQGVHRKLTLL